MFLLKIMAFVKKAMFLPFLLLSIMVILSTSAEAETRVSRVEGEDRYGTAVEISMEGWEEAETVILTRGDKFPDALAGTPLAYQHDAPMLLTDPEELNEVTREELQRLEPEQILVLGGNAAVSDTVLEEIDKALEDATLEIERVYGVDRFGTAEDIAERLGDSSQAIMVYGRNFPDALSVASYAAQEGIPLILTERDSLPDAAHRILEGIKELYVVGGDAVISEDLVENELPANIEEYQRISGADRYETAALFLDKLDLVLKNAFVATGEEFPDALAGSAWAAKEGTAVLPVATDQVPDSIRSLMVEHREEIGQVTILGGSAAVSEITGKALEDILNAVPGSLAPLEEVKMGWQFMHMNSEKHISKPPEETGFNIYAPVAYELKGEGAHEIEIDVKDNVIQTAQQNGYKNWVTIQEIGSERLETIFEDEQQQTRLIEELINQAIKDDVHGINVNFENLGTDAFMRERLTSFMEELHQETTREGMYLSIDVTRLGDTIWSAAYDHQALAEASDYLILMAYDEHWGGSPVAGPVSSLSWTEDGVIEVLDKGVPSEQLVLGVPFYSRIWKINDSDLILEEDKVVLTEDGVNIRPEPYLDNEPIIYLAPEDSMMTYLDKVEGEAINENPYWYEVDLGDEVGYVTTEYSTRKEKGKAVESYIVTGSSPMGLEACREIMEQLEKDSLTVEFYPEGEVELDNIELEEDDEGRITVVSGRDEEGYLRKIWLETYQTMQERYAIKERHDLAGIAAWSLDWQGEVDDIWWEMMD